MSKLIMLVGIPGAGKSTYAESLDGIIVSSDGIRKELYGNEDDQRDPSKVFKIMDERCIELLRQGEVVIYDATNIYRVFRLKSIALFNDYSDVVECHVINTPLEVALKRNDKRCRKVSEEVIEKLYKDFEVPKLEEGIDRILILNENFEVNYEI